MTRTTGPEPGRSVYTQVIDLTSKGQRDVREEEAKGLFQQADPLPVATPETLPDGAREAFEATGWASLMPVQEQAIPYILGGQDLIVQSRTGSGKTGAFLLPLFTCLDASRAVTQALILTPTRELARQIFAEFERMNPSGALRGGLVYGGVGYRPQEKALKGGAQFVVGTPGRILDHLERRTFSLQELHMFILDEADEMLSMGFYPAMMQMKRHLPSQRRSYMFSATMPPKVRMLGQEFLRAPSFLGLSAGQISVESIEHRYYRIGPMEKDRSLVALIEMENPDSAIIFCNTRREVEYLTTFLSNYGHDVAAISGDLSQPLREAAMGQLRRGELRFLVATDVAARGIDISDLSHVFQYDVPLDPEYYVHRTGRTARAGKAGTAITLVTLEDEGRLLSIGQRYEVAMEKRTMPEPEDIATRIAERMVVVLEEKMRSKSNLERERLERFVPLVAELASEEPELLALLVDELYQVKMHASAPQPDRKDKRDRGRPRGRR